MKIFQYFQRDTNQKVIWTKDKLVTYVLASGDNFSDRWRDNWIKKLRWKLKPYLKGKKQSIEFLKQFGLEK